MKMKESKEYWRKKYKEKKQQGKSGNDGRKKNRLKKWNKWIRKNEGKRKIKELRWQWRKKEGQYILKIIV